MPPRFYRLPRYVIFGLLLVGLPAVAQEQPIQVILSDAVRTELAASLGLATDIIATQVSLPADAAASACGVQPAELTDGSCAATASTDEVRAAVMQAIEAGAAEKN